MINTKTNKHGGCSASRMERGSRLASLIYNTPFREWKVLMGISILCAIVATAIFAPFLAPHDPYAMDLSKAHRPPAWMAGGLPDHLLGTDYIGRDVLSRVIYGSRVSLAIGIGGVVIASLLGIFLGLLAGTLGGWVDVVIMRVVDSILAVPWILLVVFIVGIFGSSLITVILVLGFTDFALFTRVVRSDVLALREREFILATISIGARPWRIISRHLFPNIIGAVITLATFELASMILWEAGLGFLGLSVPPTIPSWGNMMAEGRNYLRTDWWLVTFPGLAVTLLALSVNLTGDWLRFFLDPRSRGTK